MTSRRQNVLRLFASALFAVLTTPGVVAQIPDLDPTGNPVRCDLRGRVDSESYAFDVPPGLSACRIWPRVVTIPLGAKDEDRMIHVGYSPNSLGLGSFPELRAFHCDDSDGPVECTDTTLDTRPVVRVVRPASRAGSGNIVEVLATLGEERLEDGTIKYEYSIQMVTDQEHLAADRDVLEKVLRSWWVE